MRRVITANKFTKYLKDRKWRLIVAKRPKKLGAGPVVATYMAFRSTRDLKNPGDPGMLHGKFFLKGGVVCVSCVSDDTNEDICLVTEDNIAAVN